MNLGGEEAGKELKAVVQTIGCGRKVGDFTRGSNVRVGVANLWTSKGSVTTPTWINLGGQQGKFEEVGQRKAEHCWKPAE